MINIRFRNIKKIYPGENLALDSLNLDIEKGEFLTLIGPADSGKTTILKMINGLVRPNEGDLFVEGENINDINPIDLRRKTGYIADQIGLFPHLNIEKNISYVLKISGVSKEKQRERAEELIELVGLGKETLESYPRELSLVDQHRVALIRSLAADPPIILMDDPFNALDEINRKLLQDELLKIQEGLEKTIVFATHDIEEALKLGDRIALINNGNLEQIDSSKEMFFNPKNKFVKDFFGEKSFSYFMNSTNILEVVDKIYPNIVFNGENDIIKLSTYKEETLKLPVIDMEGKYLGMVSSFKEDIKSKDIEYTETISPDASLMKAVERGFKEGISIVPVVDDKDKYIGIFSLDRVYKKFQTIQK